MTALNKQALLSTDKHANQTRLTRLTMEVHSDELRIMASAVESYTDELIAALEAAEKRIANNERVMRAVVEAASIRGIRSFEGIECDPPTLEENAEACGDAMSARIRELEANPPKPHHNGLMQISNELVQARQRIAELEARTITVKFEPIPMEELGNRRDGKKHPYMFGAGYNSAVVHCESVLHQACAAAGIGVKGD
ncbi:hypothetical protein [Citrobacter cronae]|uniref:hypothetical protein n=1 Tax=Citrobacter cronae TaxID=1748967 RepID=UPI00186733EF|nr:hypothetical protein [Citrobacter cronae]